MIRMADTEMDCPACRAARVRESVQLHVLSGCLIGSKDGVRSVSESSIYSSRGVVRLARDGQVPVGFDDPHVPYEADLGGGVSARIPLTLFRDGLGTYPRPQGTNPYLNGSLPTSGPLTAGEQWGSLSPGTSSSISTPTSTWSRPTGRRCCARRSR